MSRRFVSLSVVSLLSLSAAFITGAAATAYAQAAQTFNVTLVSFAIQGAPATVRAGAPLVFNANNPSPNPHNLAIDGNGVNLTPSNPNIAAGQSGTISFAALQPGTYHLYCPVGMHRANGMDVTFTVVAGATALPATGGASLPTLPLGLGAAGLVCGAAGLWLRRRPA